MAEEGDTQVSSVTPEVQAQAREFGWVPKEEFKGDETKWRDADEFLRRGQEINGFLRKDLEKFRSKYQTLEQELLNVRAAVAEFKEFHSKTEERAYAKALADLKEQKKKAIQEQDGEAVVEIDEAIDALKEQRTVEPKKTNQQPESDAVQQQQFEAWVSENKWFQTDKELQAASSGLADLVRAEKPHLRGKEFLDAVSEKVKQVFPDRFQNSARTQPGAVDSGGSNGRPASGKKSYADLPADAKAACDRFVKQGLIASREDYVKEYFEQE